MERFRRRNVRWNSARVAGVATIGAAGLEVAQEVPAETQGAVQPLVPYFDSLRWVFIAAALAGIAVAIYARINDWRAERRRAGLRPNRESHPPGSAYADHCWRSNV